MQSAISDNSIANWQQMEPFICRKTLCPSLGASLSRRLTITWIGKVLRQGSEEGLLRDVGLVRRQRLLRRGQWLHVLVGFVPGPGREPLALLSVLDGLAEATDYKQGPI